MNCVRVMLTAGVPLKTPSAKLSPDGNAGSMPHSLTLPPETEGSNGTMVVPRISVRLAGLYSRLTAGSRMVMLMVAAAEPPELLA